MANTRYIVFGVLIILICVSVLKGDDLGLYQSLKDLDPQILSDRNQCYQQFPASTFQLYTLFAWRLPNPTTKCLVHCFMSINGRYMDSNGVMLSQNIKDAIRQNKPPESEIKALDQQIDKCSKEKAIEVENKCEKAFQFLLCFYQDSLLTSLAKNLQLFSYF